MINEEEWIFPMPNTGKTTKTTVSGGGGGDFTLRENVES